MKTVCDRCGQEIENGYSIPAVRGTYGSTCVKIVARENGIKWTARYGPLATNIEALRLAIVMQKRNSGFAWEAKKAHKALVGSVAWNFCSNPHGCWRINSDEAATVYTAVREALES